MILRKLSILAGVVPLLLTQSLVNPVKSLETKPILMSQNKTCRQVNSDTSIDVRNAPTGPVIGRLESADQVYIAGKTNSEWVQISYPMAGYVYAGNLAYCSGNNVTNLSLDNNSLITQNTDTVPGSNCRQVNKDKLLVYSKPNGQIVGRLTEEQQVMIANEGFNGWVPIEYPVSGYIASQYLTDCENTANLPTSIREGNISTVPGGTCRQIMSPDVPVRSEPMGDVIGKLDKDNQVSIANEGYDGWVPIESPVSGYVTSANLGDCTFLNNQ